jgi:hypothetical protein
MRTRRMTAARGHVTSRQEDAHEFLGVLLDGLDKCLLGAGGPDKEKKRPNEGTVAKAVFGGAVRSEVTCPTCKHVSITVDPVCEFSRTTQQVSRTTQQVSRTTQHVSHECARAAA